MTATITIATDETKPLVSPSASQDRNLCSGPSAVYQNLSKRHDWPVKIAIVDLPIRLKKKNQNALPVIRWVRRGPRTRASALLRRGWVKCWLRGGVGTTTTTLLMDALDLKVVLITGPNKGPTIKKQNILCISRKRTSCFTSLLI